MSSLPPPPGPASTARRPHDALASSDAVRPGDLTFFWRAVVTAAWMAAFFAYAAVWQASVQLGIATWWVGPRSEPEPVAVRLLPFLATVVVILLIVYNVRGLSRVLIAAATLTALIALPDFSRSVGLAVVEVIISASLLVVAVAAHAGRYRLRLEPSGTDIIPDTAPGTGPVTATDADPDIGVHVGPDIETENDAERVRGTDAAPVPPPPPPDPSR